MGHEVVNVLIREMARPEEAPRYVVFPTELVVRESTVGDGGARQVGLGWVVGSSTPAETR